MNKEQLNSIINFTEELVQLGDVYKEAKEDGRISIWERFKIFNELSDVIQEAKELKADHLSNITEREVDTLSTIIMNSIDREVKFKRWQLVKVIKIAQLMAQLFVDNED